MSASYVPTKVACMAEIFKMWYFIIFDRKTINFRVLACSCSKRLLLTAVFIGNTLFILFIMRMFFEKISSNILFHFMEKQLFYLLKWTYLWSLDINFSFEGPLLGVVCVSLFFLFPCFQISILKIWAEG